jgi:protein-tyrosine phosphatase
MQRMPFDRTNIAVALEGATNFRDLGGLPTTCGHVVRRARVFRSDHLGRLSDADHDRLRALGVTHCVDLRGHAERTATPDHFPGIVMEHLGIEPTVFRRLREFQTRGAAPDRSDAVALMRETYRDFVRLQGPTFGRLLARIAGHRDALVFHCTAGKDRTGMAAALLLESLGVHRDDIMEDYLLTNALYRRDHRLTEALSQEVLDVLWQVQADFIHTAWRSIDQEFGGVERYLETQVGLEGARREQLREQLLVARNAAT